MLVTPVTVHEPESQHAPPAQLFDPEQSMVHD
jgi:hypothetical protein